MTTRFTGTPLAALEADTNTRVPAVAVVALESGVNTRTTAFQVVAFEYEPPLVEKKMRYEAQDYKAIRATTEIVVSGVAQTGLTVVTTLHRLSDGLWWNGSAWGATATSLSLTEVDATDLAGLYVYELPNAAGDTAADDEGYIFRITEATQPIVEHLFVQPTHVGDDLYRLLRLRQHNMRITNATFNSQGLPETGTVKVFDDSANALADTNETGEYAFTATYDGTGRLTSYVSTKTS